ncbi:tripartite tricarboxylate transporter TctB family protein [uncultured Cohaesibacter sp.]|uniref:tripartite tricarboxylate transporter TctB family protein n=1 Tax=uncultured Cohaesibacter sp. TaxID=1002546 RepID=UPI002931D151|nr:tripartite tricarboxylate transporter TctB family protein [uncultured Cohaesibacter sp.]
MAEGSSLLKVSIDFSQSHLFFPNIIHWILLILIVLIALTKGPAFVRSLKDRKDNQTAKKSKTDWMRLLGTIVLTIIYFSLMETVGDFFPNMGLGFLLTSIPFMFLLSILYVHEPGRRELVTITLSSIISPTVAWYVLAQMFNITLP